jgi:hypothetical protein
LIADTRRLFARLLRTLEIATVCDIGSMDGSDALRFRRRLPDATVLALEPNPSNFELVATDDGLRRGSIRDLLGGWSDEEARTDDGAAVLLDVSE